MTISYLAKTKIVIKVASMTNTILNRMVRINLQYMSDSSNDSHKREVQVIGSHTCEYCREADDRLSEKFKNDKTVEYRFVDVESEEANRILDEEGFRKNSKVDIPLIRDCKVVDDGKKKCRTIEGFEPNDWLDDALDSIETSVDI